MREALREKEMRTAVLAALRARLIASEAGGFWGKAPEQIRADVKAGGNQIAASRLKVSALEDCTEGFAAWGKEQADLHYDDLIAHFERPCENPLLYMAR